MRQTTVTSYFTTYEQCSGASLVICDFLKRKARSVQEETATTLLRPSTSISFPFGPSLSYNQTCLPFKLILITSKQANLSYYSEMAPSSTTRGGKSGAPVCKSNDNKPDTSQLELQPQLHGRTGNQEPRKDKKKQRQPLMAKKVLRR